MANDPLEELRKRLYKKEESFEARLRRPELTPHPAKTSSSWEEEKISMPKKSSFNKKRAWWAVAVLFLVAAGAGAVYFYFFFQAVSPRKIEISVSAPASAVGGEGVRWDVLISNNNQRALEAVEFIFEYPSGSRVLDEDIRGLRSRKILGRIGPGESVRLSFNAFVFGFENEEKEINFALEYRPEGSSAILSKEGSSKIVISRSPVGVSFDLPGEIRAGQEMELKINYVSNSESRLENLVLEFEPPPGFTLKKAVPEPEAGGREWVLGGLNPGEKRTITIIGILSGGELDEKSFKARAGVKTLGEFSVYGQNTTTVLLRRPFLEVDAKINGQDSYIVNPGEILEVEISFRNNLPVPVQNAVIEALFSGRGVDERQIRVRDGIYRSLDRKAIWNASSAPILERLDPGQGGTLRMQLSFLEPFPRSSADKDFKTLLDFEIKPGVVPSGFAGVDTTGEDALEVKLNSRLQLARRGLYFSSLLPNSGPLPPRVGRETTFTVTWSLINSTSDLDDVTVRASLPPYVNWKAVFVPNDAALTFDPNSGEIIWRVGELKAGVGYISPAKEVSFRIGFIPSVNQVGQSPDLVLSLRAQGRDSFTGTILSVQAPLLTLELKDAPRVDDSQMRVIE